MPFWMDAVLFTANTPKEFGAAVGRARDTARTLRATRGELEAALAYGDAKEIRRLMSALQGDCSDFSGKVSEITSAVPKTMTAVAKIFLPAAPIEAVGTAAEHAGKIGKGWFEEVSLRLFRPQFWCIYSMGKRALRLQRSLEKLFVLFELKRGETTRPKKFIESLGFISWIA